MKLLSVLCILGLIAALIGGCTSYRNQPVAANPQESQPLSKFTTDDPDVQTVMAVQDRHTPDWMKDPNVLGSATTINADGKLSITILVENGPNSGKGRTISTSVPASVEGVPVNMLVTGKIVAMASHTALQTPPIQLGTSGGWRYDLANGYCCSGTLGSLIKKGTTQYVLSNYHVFWGDIVSGGNGRVATAGDPVIQPGMVDIGCNANNAQNVATLSGSGSLPGANVDAGYAQVISGMVSTSGAILDIGTISATTVAASIGQAVKKSGRTTGLSRSSISGLNATVSVQYDNECAGGVAFTKTFTGQILVANKRSRFLNSGDSGSLMVEDVTTNARAVGLLYAGSNTIAVANPIDAVLSWAGGATMVGN